MNKVKIVWMVCMAIALTALKTQSNSSLMGQWESTYDIEGQKISVSYEFKHQDGQLLCHTLSVRDENGEEEAHPSVAMTNIHFEDGKGKAQYLLEYEGETYEVAATLKMINSNTLKVSYSYYGYADTEIWKRIE